MTFRATVEKRSAPVLVLLSQQPRLLVPVLSLLLLVGGLALPPAAGVLCLLVLLAFVLWLSYLSWPAVVGQARVLRFVTIGLVVFAVVRRALEI